MNILETLLSGLTGSGQAQASQPMTPMPATQPMPRPAAGPQAMPVPTGPTRQQPSNGQPRTMRPTPIPAQPPAPRPSMAAPATAPAQAPAQPMNPLQQFLMAGGAGGDWRTMARAAGSGMANVQDTGGDPWRAFGQGFGGATGYYDARAAAEAKARSEAEQTGYDRSQDAYERDRQARQDEIRDAAERRAQAAHDMDMQKSMVELRREARQQGITTSEMIRIDAEARKHANDFAPLRDPDGSIKRRLYEEKREELLGRAGVETDRGGLSPTDDAPPKTGRLSVGQIVDGYEYLGGDPNSPDSWSQSAQ